MNRNDILWKGILEDIFDDFLLFFFKEQAALFDFEKGFEFLDKELEQIFPGAEDATSPKFVDKLVKVFTKAGTEEWVLVHVEVQGYDDPSFAKRMFTYFYRILDTYNKPVTSIVIFTDGNKNFHPKSFTYNFLGASVEYKFNTYKIIDQDESELAKSTNPFAIVILTVLLALKKGKIAEEQLFSLKFALGRKLLGIDMDKEKARALMNFLRYYVIFDTKENIAKFDAQINAITNKKTTMGIEELLLYTAKKEGKQEGRQEGIEEGIESGANAKTIEFTTNLLLTTDHSIEKIASLVGVPVSFVLEIKKSLDL